MAKIALPRFGAAILFAAFLFSAGIAQEPRAIHIALAKSFLNEQPKAVQQIAADDLQTLIKKTTGLAGDLTTKLTAADIAAKLDEKKIDFGIFHAYEFAWAQKKNPKLEPLLIATDNLRVDRAYLIVNQKNPAKAFADLRGKKVDLPVGIKDQCLVFLDQLCRDQKAKAPADFFSAIEKSASNKAALDAVAAGTVDATVIDRNGLDFYKEVRGPVFDKHLRVSTESADFPPAVIAYKPGDLNARTVEQFKAGLLKAHTMPEDREIMKTWHIHQFEAVPKDYAKQLADVLKAYPPP